MMDENITPYGTRRGFGSTSYSEQVRDERLLQMIKDPTRWPNDTRKILRNSFGISMPRPTKSRNSGRKSAGRLRSINNFGSPVEHNKNNYLATSEPNPIILDKQLKNGMLGLINTDVIAKGTDLTNIMNHQPQLMNTRPAQKHTFVERYERRPVQTMDYGQSISNIKLDISATPYVNSVKDKISMVARKPQNSLSVIAIGAQDEPVVYANKESEVKKTDQQEISDMLAKSKEPVRRNFNEMMDEFSSHIIVLRPQSGVLATPEFLSYQRTYERLWGPITSVIMKLTKLLQDYGFNLGYVDGKRVAAFAEDEIGIPTLTVEQLMSCLVDLRGGDQARLVKDKKMKMNYNKGPFGKALAAIMIQKTWRMYAAVKAYKLLKYKNKCASIIQCAWMLRRRFFDTRNEINRRLEIAEQSWRKIMDEFRLNWPQLKTKRRYIIHVASLSYTQKQRMSIPKFKQLQNSQLFRLCDLVDENVEVLYVSAFPVSDDAIQYVTKILQIAGVTNPEKRFKFVYPESFDKYPDHISLTSSLLLSERTIKHIKGLMSGKEVVYIVPGVSSKDEFRLALKLQVPILGADPSKHLIYGTKSGCRRIFAAADLNTPPGFYDVHNERELLLQLSKKIIENPEYQQWLIKIDNEFGGRGTAVLDIARIRCLSEEGRQEIVDEVSAQNNMEGFLDVLRDRLFYELREFISTRMRMVSPFVYPTWSDFVQGVKINGGVIEAVPTNVVGSPVVNLFIEPDGTISILSCQEQLLSPQFCSLGAAFPQNSVPHEALRDASMSVGRVCVRKHIFGYVSIQYIVFIGEESALKLWAVDLNLHLTNNSLLHMVFDHAASGQMDQETGHYVSKKQDVVMRKSYVYGGLMRHPQFQTWRHSAFFALCRQKGISFDLSTRTGTLFHLVDTLNKGLLGIICIGKTPTEAIVSFDGVIDFVTNQLDDEFTQPVDNTSNVHSVMECSKELISKCIRNTSLTKSVEKK